LSKDVSIADLAQFVRQRLEELLKLVSVPALCYSCKHCRSIDILLKVDCDLCSGGLPKLFCRNYCKKEG
jgi:hypothetical protein